MSDNKNKASLLRSLALDLIDTDERREETKLLLDECLPHLAVEIENSLHEQEARLFYEIFTEQHRPKIRVVFKLKKLEHEYQILLDSKNAMFVIGSERTGETASNAMDASNALKNNLMKFKA